jgi:ribosomal protein L7Ae-like RNA K-turn-binding protein
MLPMDQTEGLALVHQLLEHPQQEVVVVAEEWDKADLCNHLVALEEEAEEAPRTAP